MRKQGFTLVELLIVIAVIGIFTAISIGSVSISSAKARDTKRVSDMKEIQLGLALYFDVNKAYPVGTTIGSLSGLVTQAYLPSIPTDPKTNQVYEYYSVSGSTYCIGVKLENIIPNDNKNCLSAPSGQTANYTASR